MIRKMQYKHCKMRIFCLSAIQQALPKLEADVRKFLTALRVLDAEVTSNLYDHSEQSLDHSVDMIINR